MSDDDIQREADAVETLNRCLDTIAEDFAFYWHWGDGMGGWVFDQLAKRVRDKGYTWPHDQHEPSQKRKDKISRTLSKAVFERDGYRCVECQDHIDLCCDHVVPESKGGPTTFDNLQTLCRPCNSRKGARFPE